MLNCRLVSDLHIEKYTDFTIGEIKRRLCEESSDIDLLILAGDIVDGDTLNNRTIQVYEFFEALSLTYPHIVYVLGNHEYYGLDLTDGERDYREFLKPFKNIKVASSVTEHEYNGIRMVLGTLWCNFNNNPLAQMQAESKINDFKEITCNDDKLYGFEYTNRYNKTIDFLHKIDNVDMMIFHYSPLLQSTNPKINSSLLDYAWLNNIPYELLCKATLVIHGHTHHAVNYKHGDVTVLATNQTDWVDFQIGEGNVQII